MSGPPAPRLTAPRETMGGSSMVICTVPMTALGGGRIALQAMAVSTGLPFTLVLLAACYVIIRG
ncbi:hypothetical protein [Rhodovulum strictum]|uniref:Uncharacterized protein n=1 Tax=Rhodovulum strictum TaxID=58314 RepID=A0A844BI14_9RHOB|nr:hypothetical protein [Rhodovulum strictum]MRH22118.1 hypothetical protein [Rhodovulum strictum]